MFRNFTNNQMVAFCKALIYRIIFGGTFNHCCGKRFSKSAHTNMRLLPSGKKGRACGQGVESPTGIHTAHAVETAKIVFLFVANMPVKCIAKYSLLS